MVSLEPAIAVDAVNLPAWKHADRDASPVHAAGAFPRVRRGNMPV